MRHSANDIRERRALWSRLLVAVVAAGVLLSGPSCGTRAPGSKPTPSEAQKAYWSDFNDDLWRSFNWISMGGKAYYGTRVMALQSGNGKRAVRSYFKTYAMAVLLAGLAHEWQDRPDPGDPLDALHGRFVTMLAKYSAIRDRFGGSPHSVEDLARIDEAMKNWGGGDLHEVIDASRSAAEAAGLPYNSSLEYWMDYSNARAVLTDPGLVSLIVMRGESTSRWRNKSRMTADLTQVSDYLLDMDKGFKDWEDRPQPPSTMSVLDERVSLAIDYYQPRLNEIRSLHLSDQPTREQQDRFWALMDEFSGGLELISAVDKEAAQVGKEQHLVVLQP